MASIRTQAVTVGSASETVTVTAQSPLIQTQSGERSFAVSAEAVQAIAVNGRAYNTPDHPGPRRGRRHVNGLRANRNTLQMEGITSVDTGNNGNAVTLSLDAVQEVKVRRPVVLLPQPGISAGAGGEQPAMKPGRLNSSLVADPVP